ncbi:XcbB/CpsF family capsular polysaccharide biosynthesis protein [Actinobacillus pleuropneumoniae]|uniref:XcbB/CpsF family capsular polysaccharide biosynthesis protein n=2 Tax=Actinobacillus pleuropneumoniae TaxID=715 RepID=UPI0001E49632|nr:XcbB/CpsF family capsular polysaccharide biosynthesis protein [Actinobacillus pleuropneumoniae]EFM93515.1 hypothetical protein appser9_17110 [Actinobacillus pleuropneumoniae serovar 9 str. CVJ13261]EFM97839.1 hypothetical protein appser11_17230 [Actinobacillus pleuropneumoniae serovar 11 str. 56153]MCL7710658.1 XcbB/CpsF family capsular polysaccharide biosynthesis protein [Actinobacillus pleuropneumoniae]MCL7711646.1 XcbB/CpsF family capsular polysaccharide biosynthesis protein [Actinobacill
MLDFFRIKFDQNTKCDELNIDLSVKEIYIDKSAIGKDEKEKLNHNFLAVGRGNIEAKKLIAKLSNNKYYLTAHSNGISIFTKFSDGKSFISHFKNKNVKVWNDTFYTLDEPLEKDTSINRLLVVFSSIADLAFNASIERRMFFTNFPSVGKYIPKNTYILRIADIGGVLGSFYLNNNADMKFENKVESLIRKVQMECSVPNEYTVLYGTSKGATGALYHGVNMKLKTLAVDPIVHDEHYIKKFNDLHFVQNVFPESKQEKFSKLFQNNKDENLSHIKLVTSKNSEQFNYISEIVFSESTTVCSYIFNNPNIKGHTDMGEHTLNFVTAMLNNLLYDIDVKSNLITVY